MARKIKTSFIKWADPPAKSSLFAAKRAGTKSKKPTGWVALRMKLEQKPGQWALIRVSVKRPIYTNKQRHGLEIVTRQFEDKGKVRYGTWARVPASKEQVAAEIVKESFSGLTDDYTGDSL